MAEHVTSEEHSDVSFVGAPDSLEERIATEAGLDFIGVRARGWDRARPVTLVLAALTTAASFFTSLILLRRTRADVVIGFGGYVSLPLGLAAALAGVPLVLHEQNSIPGLANRVLARWAATVCVTYPDSIAYLPHPARALVTGDPVREAVLRADRAAGRSALHLRKNDTVLLLFGGSRGARHLNSAFVSLSERLRTVKGLRVVHVAGPTEVETVTAAVADAFGGKAPAWWQVHPYLERMGDAIAAADLVVCRAGATTIAELTALGRPAVLVPYPFATDDHQTHNAEPLEAAGAAIVIADRDVDSPAFGDAIAGLLADRERRAEMAASAAHLGYPYAAHAVAEAAIEVGCARSPWRHRRDDPAAVGAPVACSTEPPVEQPSVEQPAEAAEAVAEAPAEKPEGVETVPEAPAEKADGVKTGVAS